MPGTRKIGGQAIEMTERRTSPETKYYEEDEELQARADTKNIESKTWYNKYGKKHRDGDMAAEIIFHNDPGNEVKKMIWYKNGKKHREIGPAESHYGRSGATREGDMVDKNGQDEMPTEGKYKKGGKTRRKRRRRKGTRKRRKKRSSRRH